MDEAARAIAAAVNFEAKKDRLAQNQSGDWKLTLTVADLPDAVMKAPMGQRYQVVVVAIGADERPIPPEPATGHRRWRELRPSQRAALLCKNAAFRDWFYADSEAEAAAAMRKRYGVSSRAELDQDQGAREAFECDADGFFDYINRPPDEVYQ